MAHDFPSDGIPTPDRPHRPLPRRFSELVIFVVAIVMALYAGWSLVEQDRSVEDKALTEARALNRQMLASWAYIDEVQDAINYNEDGTYDFKGVYCATAAKSIAEKFTDLSDGYAIRYVRTDPRAAEDKPDEFEERAIAALASQDATEFYEMTDYAGQPVLRFASRLNADRSCLKCHGDPRGTLDEIGFFREGMGEGDLAGIASIIVPVQEYRDDAFTRTATTLLLFLLLLVAMVALVRWGLKQWVTDPLAAANEKLARANRELEEASSLREEFLATISHELRTPLSSIIAFTDLWQDEDGGGDKQRQLVEQVGQNSKVLLNMVNNMIDTARVDAGKYQLVTEEIDLVDEVVDLRAMAGPLAERKRLRFSATIDGDVPLVHSDWTAIHTILGNLVANALAFTDAGGSVRLSIARDGTDFITATVQDTGCGIAPEDLERIFKKFERPGIEQRTDNVGSGLGLGLARNLARLLGGDITVRSEVGVGSTFTLRLPVDRRESDEDTRC